jgi:hypothetical protein
VQLIAGLNSKSNSFSDFRSMKFSSILSVCAVALAFSFTACREQGCTDAMATNYNPQAKVDDRSCNYVIGCKDCLALNYDSTAVSSDGSCEYAQIDHLFTYTVTDSVVDKNQNVSRDTYDVVVARDTCGVYNVTLSNYAKIKQSDNSILNVSGYLLGDSIYFNTQVLLGPDTFIVDKITVSETRGFFRNDSIFLPLVYTNRFDPFYGFMSGSIKL